MTNKLVKLGSLKGPKGDPGFTIIGEISSTIDLDNLTSELSTYKPKINDAWIIKNNSDDSEITDISYKNGSVWVYRGEDYEYPEGAITHFPFEYVTNLRGPKGEVSQNIHFAATYNDFVTAKYYNETMKVGDAVIDNGEADFSRKGNMYKITDISEYVEDDKEDLYGKWIAVSDINQIKNNTAVIVVSNTDSKGSFCMHKKMDVNNLSNYLFLNPVNSYWNQAGAVFYVYFFNNSNSTYMWKKMEVVDSAASTKIYYTEKEEGYPKCIFVRVNPAYTGTDYWYGTWNQTADLDTPTSTQNLYTITGWGSNNGPSTGSWAVYTSKIQKTTTILAESIPVHIDVNGNKYIEDSDIDELSIFYLRYLDSSPRQFSFYNSSYNNDASIYCVSDAVLKIGTGDENNEFILDKSIDSINGYFKNIDTGKWIGVRTDYNDWRGYENKEPNKANNINLQSFDIFVYLTKDLYGPSNPKVTIDTNTVIELDPNKPNVYNAGSNISINDLTINATGYKYDSTTKSFAAGENINTATGNYAFAEGNATEASGKYSHAEGNSSKSTGEVSHSEGYKTTASGKSSHAEGYGVEALGLASHAEGWHDIDNSGELKYTVRQADDDELKYNIISDLYGTDGKDGIFYLKHGMTFFYNNKYCYVTEVIYDESNVKPIAFKLDKSFYKPNTNIEIKLLMGKSIGAGSHTEGNNTVTYGYYSHAEGNTTRAAGSNSHTEGSETASLGDSSHAEGRGTVSIGDGSHAEGIYSHAEGSYSHAEGYSSHAEGFASHAEGYSSHAEGYVSHAEGNSSHAEGYASHAEGNTTRAVGSNSHAEGSGSIGIGPNSHAEGEYTRTEGYGSHAEGSGSHAKGNYSHAEGSGTTAQGSGSHAEGSGSIGIGTNSHAEGLYTLAEGLGSHAEGSGSHAEGDYSHAEGYSSHAEGYYSHAEGDTSVAFGSASHAEGSGTTAQGTYSHAEGSETHAEGSNSHAEGSYTHAKAIYSHTEGYHTIANNMSEHAEGEYNKSNTGTISSIGIGINVNDRKNALEVMRTGDMYVYGIGDYDGTNSVVEDGSTKAKTLQKVVEELKDSKCPTKFDELIYSIDGQTHKTLQLLHNGFIVQNQDEFDECAGSDGMKMNTVFKEWYSYGASDTARGYWGYCDSIIGTDSEESTILVNGTKKSGLPVFTKGGKPQDYILYDENHHENSGYFSRKKYSNYDTTVAVGCYLNNVGSGEDYIAQLIAMNCDIFKDETTNQLNYENACGISLHTLNLYDTAGRDGIYCSRPNRAEFLNDDNTEIIYGNGNPNFNSTIQISCFKQPKLNADTTNNIIPVKDEINIPLLSFKEGLSIIPNLESTQSAAIQSRVKRENNIITIWLSDPYYIKNDSGYVDDLDIVVKNNMPIIINLDNYTLTYTDNDGGIHTKDFSENAEQTPTWESTFKLNEQTIINYTENQIKWIREIFDSLKEEAYIGYETKSTGSAFFRYVKTSLNDITILRTDDKQVYIKNGNEFVQVPDTDIFKELKSGSRLVFNSVTGKLFYNDGVNVYQIASISEGSSSGDSGSSGGSSDGDSGSDSSQSFTLNPAKEDTLGGIMVGSNLNITDEGVLTAKGYGWNSSTNTMTITTSGEAPGKIHAAGGFYETSDARKKDVQGELSLDKAYDFIRNCEPILYNLKGSDKTQIGLIAQEVREFFPEIVNEDSEGYLSLDYAKLTVIILRVLKDLIDKK
jgi:hypothetical protein